MLKNTDISIQSPSLCFGGEIYSIIVTINNESGSRVEIVSVSHQLIPGGMLIAEEVPENEVYSELLKRKHEIIQEMEIQLKLAYRRKALREMNPNMRLIFQIVELFTQIFSKILGYIVPVKGIGLLTSINVENFGEELAKLSNISYPHWARQAIRIDNLDDIERLENEIMSHEDEGSDLRIAYSSDKEKLNSIFNEIVSITNETQRNINETYLLENETNIGFPFRARAPRVFRRKADTIQFRIIYKENGEDINKAISVSDTMIFHPANSVVILGSVLGALIGNLVRVTLINPTNLLSLPFLLTLLGSTAIAIIVTLLTLRKPDSNKPFTTEDFVGGLILGALSSMFFESFLVILKAVVDAF